MAAFTIPSNIHTTRSTVRQLFGFISEFKNFKSILPEDKVEDFSYADDKCSFSIKGITPMTIHMAEKVPYSTVFFSSEGLSKFNFNLRVFFTGDPDSKGECRVELQGDLNPFIVKMAQKPLASLVNTMSLRLSELEITEQTPLA